MAQDNIEINLNDGAIICIHRSSEGETSGNTTLVSDYSSIQEAIKGAVVSLIDCAYRHNSGPTEPQPTEVNDTHG